jgi:hypothetical protein
MRLRAFCAALVALSFDFAAHAETPARVEAASSEAFGACLEAGGTPSAGAEYLTEAELNGDGVPDFVMNLAGLNCENAASLFCGSAGCPVTVWLSGPVGYFEGWSGYAQGIVIEGQTVVAFLHGQFCDPPRAGVEGCEQRLEFAGVTGIALAPEARTEAEAEVPAAAAPDPGRWELRRPEGSPAVAVVGGPGGLRSMAAFCLDGQPWLALLFHEAQAADRLALQFTFAAHGPIGGPAQREATSGGAYMVTLQGSPLAAWLAGRDDRVELRVEGEPVGTVSLAGSGKALRGALEACLRF